MNTPIEDLSILHRQYEVKERYLNVVEASIGLPPEQKSQLVELKRGEILTAPQGYTITRRR